MKLRTRLFVTSLGVAVPLRGEQGLLRLTPRLAVWRGAQRPPEHHSVPLVSLSVLAVRAALSTL